MLDDALVTESRRNDSDLAARLMRALTDPDFALEERDRHPDLSQVSDEELGSLLVAAYRVDASATHAMTMVRFAVEDAAGERQPRYTPDACRRMFEALVERCEEHGRADLTRFFVLAGDRQVEDLDEVVDLMADPDLVFIKLVALVGG
ncbi:hypothetical protein [Streptomyces sp. NPDC001537]